MRFESANHPKGFPELTRRIFAFAAMAGQSLP